MLPDRHGSQQISLAKHQSGYSMGASESAPEKPAEAETSPPPRRKVVLKVRMHSLGHGRMEEVPLEVTCPADMRVGIVVSKLADAKQRALGAAALSRGRLPRWGPVAPTREEGAWRPPRRPALAPGPIGTTGVTFFATGNLSAERAPTSGSSRRRFLRSWLADHCA